MGKSSLKIPRSELSGRLQYLMLLRVLFVSLLLGASIFIQIKETKTYFGYIQTSHYLLIAIIYFLTFVYAVIFKYAKNLSWLAYLQLLLDTLFVTAIIYTTGGIESIFSFLYMLAVINGSIILYRRGAMAIATSCSILYGLLLNLHYYHIINPLGSRSTYIAEHQGFNLLFLIVVNIVAFYLVGFLGSYLSEQARKSRVELKTKQIDIDKLEVLNESIINSITSGLIAISGHNKIILFNPAAEEIFGIRGIQAVGENIEDALPFLRDYVSIRLFPSIETAHKPPSFFDLPYLRPDGQKIHLRLSVSPLRLSLGEHKGHILIFHDMTEINKIEEEMKRVEGLALIGELAAGISHEIKNPMASISGSIEMLRDGLEKDEVKSRLMDIMSREINRLNHLVNDFLLFARPKKTNVEEFDLNQLVLESLELFRNSQHWHQNIDILTDFNRPVRIKSDPQQIKQVLWNLFLNACEAMPEGGSLAIEIDPGKATSPRNQRKVTIVVRDTGKGFDEKAFTQLFTPFFTTKEGGTGLGLAIVKRIIEGLGGEISGSNHLERGAQITITLPTSLSPGFPV
ncbi:MAG: PAS domain S-box protein [Desulfobacteraceae bacterium]|nr:PAS domain S-box protein [Desulfobacteraceae bacterium]